MFAAQTIAHVLALSRILDVWSPPDFTRMGRGRNAGRESTTIIRTRVNGNFDNVRIISKILGRSPARW
jgi:hypothetical protein